MSPKTVVTISIFFAMGMLVILVLADYNKIYSHYEELSIPHMKVTWT